MNGKPVLGVPAKSVINFASGFELQLPPELYFDAES